MKTEVRAVTPNVAQEMLKRNGGNRKLRQSHVDFLAHEMKVGNWLFDGQPIRLNEGGRLLDGQHRLNAIVQSGTTQEFLIVMGIDSNAFKVMDTGKNRNASDVLGIEGCPYASHVASAIRTIIKIESGSYSGNKRGAHTSNTEVLEFYEANPKIVEYTEKSELLYREFNKVIPLSLISSLKYMMAGKNVTDSEEFFNKLCTGIGLERESPIRLLRDRLLESKLSGKSLPHRYRVALIIKAWNMYRTGRTVKNLIFKEGEKFPSIL